MFYRVEVIETHIFYAQAASLEEAEDVVADALADEYVSREISSASIGSTSIDEVEGDVNEDEFYVAYYDSQDRIHVR